MSYNGTVRCNHCYAQGHNKRSCPDLTERLKRSAIDEIANGEGYDGYFGREYNKRPGVRKAGVYADGTPMAEEAKAAAKQVRRCKYCNAVGHNRRTCQVLKTDQAAWVEGELEFRRGLMAAAREHGIGVGTLLKTDRWSETHAWMVTGVRFEHITRGGMPNQGYLVCQRLGDAGRERYNGTTTIVFPEMGGFNSESWTKASVIAPITASMVTFPEDFVTEGAIAPLVKEQFANATSSCWYDNH